MDLNFEWTTKDEKLDVVRFWWREQETRCCICQDKMEPYSQAAISPWAATIEHLIPRRENGPNTVGNVRLAHRWCNNVLGALWQLNQDRAARGQPPMSAKWAITTGLGRLRAQEKEKSREATNAAINSHPLVKAVLKQWPGAKVLSWSMAAMVKNDAMPLPRGATLPSESTLPAVYDHSKDRLPRRMSALETAQWLRAEAKKKGQPWPLA